METRERCGRKRATTVEQDEAIIRLATQTPITAAKTVLPALGLTCSVDTVRERLHKAGIHNWSPSRKYMQRIPLGLVHLNRKFIITGSFVLKLGVFCFLLRSLNLYDSWLFAAATLIYDCKCNFINMFFYFNVSCKNSYRILPRFRRFINREWN